MSSGYKSLEIEIGLAALGMALLAGCAAPPAPPIPAAQASRSVSVMSMSAAAAPSPGRLLASATEYVTAPEILSENYGSVRLAWDKSPDVSVTGYAIWFGTNSASYTQSANVGNRTNATVSGITEGIRWYFAATAYDADGTESAFSNEVSVQVPVAAHISVANWQVTSFGLLGKTNVVEQSTNLANWKVVAQFVGKSGQPFSYVSTNQTKNFFRVRAK